ncbi:MAG: hypothetical protein AMJ94_18770 [Deltaproteobacteria bacterium SM23_61]|nr:MAG: hypothetical protein AMJ94_18770 [Deltaproteobacteria bacterium SM23_61]
MCPSGWMTFSIFSIGLPSSITPNGLPVTVITSTLPAAKPNGPKDPGRKIGKRPGRGSWRGRWRATWRTSTNRPWDGATPMTKGIMPGWQPIKT